MHYEKFADGSVKCIEDEIPFDLPESWAWCRIKNICAIGTGATPLKSNSAYYANGTIPWITSAATSEEIITTPANYITERAIAETNCSIYPIGTLIIAMYGEGKTRGQISELGIEACTNQACAALQILADDVCLSRYVKSYFQYSYENLRQKAKGGQQPNLNQTIIAETLITIPPYQETKRIMDSVYKCIDQINTIEEGIESICTGIENAKKRILDLAIHGQLVPQNPADEPATVLLDRIRAEKEELIRQGKIKRDKTESVIFRGDDNSYYFDIPDGWVLCPLKELFNVCSAKRVRQSDWRTEGVPFYRAREIVKLSDNGFVDNDLFISEEHYMRVKTECGVPEPGDLMISGVGTIGKVYVVNSGDRFYYKDASVLCFENRTGVIDSQFARYMFESEFIQAQMKDNSKGTTVDTITISAAMEYVCVLPPLAEQKRIVSAIETAFAHLKSISEALF